MSDSELKTITGAIAMALDRAHEEMNFTALDKRSSIWSKAERARRDLVEARALLMRLEQRDEEGKEDIERRFEAIEREARALLMRLEQRDEEGKEDIERRFEAIERGLERERAWRKRHYSEDLSTPDTEISTASSDCA